jgi:hypothetical protein
MYIAHEDVRMHRRILSNASYPSIWQSNRVVGQILIEAPQMHIFRRLVLHSQIHHRVEVLEFSKEYTIAA